MKLAADANVLLSAIIGGRARLVLSHPEVEQVFTTELTFAEVEEYALVLGRKKNLPTDILLLIPAALPVTLVKRSEYAGSVAAAVKKIGPRDPDDVELLALALEFRVPIWSNDKDFEDLNVERFTTEQLLRHLQLIP